MLDGAKPNYVKLVEDTVLPRIVLCKQTFPATRIDDPAAAVRDAMAGADCVGKITPGMSIAVTAGSRGIAVFPELLRALIDEIKARGAHPFIVPAMGSHGGATAEGQVKVLEKLGVTEASMDCEIRSSMETVEVGTLENGMVVRIDKHAYGADGIVLFNRIKPHTSFRAPNESGLAKMLSIGLGKQSGAESCHSRGIDNVPIYVDMQARVKLATCKVLFGLGSIENAYDQLAKVVVLDSEGLIEAEQPFLQEAMANMPRLPLGDPEAPVAEGELDVLVVDMIGKEFSGTGMDPNITHRFSSQKMQRQATINIKRLAALELSPQSAGNGNGAARADVVTARLEAAFDREAVYANSLTSTVLMQAKMPMVMPDDRSAIQAVVKTCEAEDLRMCKLIRIPNTLHLGYLYVSEAMLAELEGRPGFEVVGELEEMRFENGRIANPWPKAH
ncbi:lactate racemase domain-containing protein [Pseudooceanicola nanhaiensis]|uniref:lactate racemase domain-containing protein n=1 Tax=Pseudooceanicola nanhaiensis TaxID=375761 RepID=UPI001CD2745D|nr:lactate racemase domain-containing protein [Pseudooceanicola nanhaiensis]MCA0920858.1 nickel-dependent lactate racemase [Pseudooceanicola nanhaiensis]